MHVLVGGSLLIVAVVLSILDPHFFMLIIPSAAFLVGNIIPDLVFVPYIVLREETVNIKKLISSESYKKTCIYSELVLFVISGFVLMYIVWFVPHSPALIWVSFMFMVGVITHIIMDLFIREKSVWW